MEPNWDKSHVSGGKRLVVVEKSCQEVTEGNWVGVGGGWGGNINLSYGGQT